MTGRSAPVRRRGEGEAGFTLLEMVVALALAALVSLVLLSGVGLAARGMQRLSEHADRLDERRGLEMLMRRALAAAVPLPLWNGRPGFVGAPTSLSFLSTIDDGRAGLYRIRLRLDRFRGKAAVLLNRHLAGSAALPEAETSVLLNSVKGFELSYFGAVSPGGKPGWQRYWDGVSDPPELVRISVDGGAGDARPPIVVRVRDAD